MKIKLSFCIPTYNFARFIGQTLHSIVSQANNEIEIVIVDGASTDNTLEIVQDYQKRFPNIRYLLREKNMGLDKDLNKSVDLAEGQYCWLLSADDVLKPGAIDRIFREISLGHDIYLFNRTECDLNLRPVRDRRWLSSDMRDHVFTLSDKGDLLYYFSRARSIGALLSYCSSIVFSRQYWNCSSYNENLTGIGYAHVYRLFSALTGYQTLKYIREALVFCRGDNDSFLTQGAIRRFLLDIDGYRLLADTIFPNDKTSKTAFLQVMKRQVRLPYLIKLRSLVYDITQWDDIEHKLLRYGYDPRTLRTARILGSLKPLVASALFLKQQLVKNQSILYKLKRSHP